MDVRVYRMASAEDARHVRAALLAEHVDAAVITRGLSHYLALWSDNPADGERIRHLSAQSVPVNLDHLPLPRRGEQLVAGAI